MLNVHPLFNFASFLKQEVEQIIQAMAQLRDIATIYLGQGLMVGSLLAAIIAIVIWVLRSHPVTEKMLHPGYWLCAKEQLSAM